MDAVETMPDHPVEANEEGFAEITAALLALCVNVARARGILLATDTVDGSKIESMVRGHWKGPPYAPSSQVIPEMIDRFGRAFVTADDRRFRGFLNPTRAHDRLKRERPTGRPHRGGPARRRCSGRVWRGRSALEVGWVEAEKTLGMLRDAVIPG